MSDVPTPPPPPPGYGSVPPPPPGAPSSPPPPPPAPAAPSVPPVPPPGYPSAPPPYGSVPGYQPAPPTPPRGKDRKLVVAGVLGVISAVVLALVGAVILIVSGDDETLRDLEDELDASISSSAIAVVGVVFIVLAAVWLVPAIGSLRGRNWARIMLAIVAGGWCALTVLGMISSGAGGGIVSLAWCGAICGLAWKGRPWA